MLRIAVDAMGADGAPRVEVQGVVSAVRAPELTADLTVILVGDEARVRRELEACGGASEPRIEVRHAPDVITGWMTPPRWWCDRRSRRRCGSASIW